MNATEQIQAAQKAELESMANMVEKTMNAFERFAQLNLQTLREAAQDATEAMRAALSARDVQELMSTQTDNPIQAHSQKAFAYAQQFAEIAASTQAEIAGAVNEGMTRMQQTLREAMQSATHNLPMGSEGAAALMQSAMNFTSQAVEAMQKTQTQTRKMVADSVQNLTQTAAKGAQEAAQSRKRRAS
ncbi:MAG: phasin family protein [Betaproteobacteria bacterium]|jgi:phasin family protein|nr:phasin family protein [Betaproteobacteria bacterium]